MSSLYYLNCPCIELERQRRSILLVGHIAVLRCIYAYFMGVPLNEIPFKEFKYHHIYELEPGPFGCTCTIIQPHLPSCAPQAIPPLNIPQSLVSPIPTVAPAASSLSTSSLSRPVSRTPTPRPSVILETQYHSMQPESNILPLATASTSSFNTASLALPRGVVDGEQAS